MDREELRSALLVLGLESEPKDEAEIRAAHRAAALLSHPDLHPAGSAEAMVAEERMTELNLARDRLLQFLSTPESLRDPSPSPVPKPTPRPLYNVEAPLPISAPFAWLAGLLILILATSAAASTLRPSWVEVPTKEELALRVEIDAYAKAQGALDRHILEVRNWLRTRERTGRVQGEPPLIPPLSYENIQRPEVQRALNGSHRLVTQATTQALQDPKAEESDLEPLRTRERGFPLSQSTDERRASALKTAPGFLLPVYLLLLATMMLGASLVALTSLQGWSRLFPSALVFGGLYGIWIAGPIVYLGDLRSIVLGCILVPGAAWVTGRCFFDPRESREPVVPLLLGATMGASLTLSLVYHLPGGVPVLSELSRLTAGELFAR